MNSRFLSVSEFDLINAAPGQYNIIAITKWQFAILRMHDTTALVHEYQFIGISVLIKIIFHALLWRSQHNMAIVVHQHRHAAL